MAEVHRVGMLTGGGDAPGLNGVIRAVTTKFDNDYGYEVTRLVLRVDLRHMWLRRVGEPSPPRED